MYDLHLSGSSLSLGGNLSLSFQLPATTLNCRRIHKFNELESLSVLTVDLSCPLAIGGDVFVLLLFMLTRSLCKVGVNFKVNGFR